MVTSENWLSDAVPARRDPWDLAVIGGGTAGIVAAKTAAGLGADVLLVERERPGGDCLWTGCVPSKTLLSAAHAARQAGSLDFADVMDRVHAAIVSIEPIDSPDSLRAAGVTVIHGEAAFTGPTSLAVDGHVVEFRQAVVASGSSPAVPPIDGIDDVRMLTSDTVWNLRELPARLLVMGGGSIGCELGQAFARLGSEVSVVEAGPRLLPREDEDAAELVAEALRSDGVNVVLGTAVASFPGEGVALLADGSELKADAVLVAVGRRPNVRELGLAAAGVDVTDAGFVGVDARLRTSNRRIWAAGDVTGHPQFTHVAGVHGSLAATNAVLGLRRAVDLSTIPRVTYTQPEVAAFGVGSSQAGRTGLSARTVHHDEVDRAVTDDREAGFSRLLLDHRGRVVGATLVGPRAGESLAEVVLAARHGLRARDLAASMHAYPTYGDGVWKAALAQLQDDLSRPWLRRVVAILMALRRRLPRA